MKRSYLIDFPYFINDAEFIRQVAFHEAGHAVAIHIRNKQKQLPVLFFQIHINHSYKWLEKSYDTEENDNVYLSEIKGGRLIHTLPSSVAKAVYDFSPTQEHEYRLAFEADVVNLLAGSLSEANYIAIRDNETISHNLINLDALHFYGGRSDLETINEYMDCLELTSTQREAKLKALFLKAFALITDQSNWHAVSRLAEYIIASKKNMIVYEDVANILA